MSEVLQSEFPRYQVFVDDKQWWLKKGEAGRTLDSWLAPVRLGGLALEQTGDVRPITDQEERELYSIADEYSANK